VGARGGRGHIGVAQENGSFHPSSRSTGRSPSRTATSQPPTRRPRAPLHCNTPRSTAAVDAAHDTMRAFMGCGRGGHVALGPSSSQLVASLAGCYARLLRPGDEVVVQEACHESNIGSWVRCAGRWWVGPAGEGAWGSGLAASVLRAADLPRPNHLSFTARQPSRAPHCAGGVLT
jgi:hypothetical protein